MYSVFVPPAAAELDFEFGIGIGIEFDLSVSHDTRTVPCSVLANATPLGLAGGAGIRASSTTAVAGRGLP